MKWNLKLLFILSHCAHLSTSGMIIIKSPETEPTYASVLHYLNVNYNNNCSDNISFSYYAAQKISAEMCQKKINTTKARNKYIITEMNALRCMRQFFAIQPEQFSENLTKYDAMCVTLNHLGISSFNNVREKLEQLKIQPSQIVFLDLNFNNLELIKEDDLRDFSNLQVLRVACNQISFLHPKSLEHTKISVLDVARNEMRNFKCLGKITLNPKVPFLINSMGNPIAKEEKERVITFLDQFAHNRYDTLRFFDINPENDELTAAMISAIFSQNEMPTVIKKIYLSYFSTDACLQNLIANNQGIIRSDDNVQLPKKYRVSNFSSYFAIKDQIVLKSSLQQRWFLCYTLFYLKERNNASLQSFVRNNASSIKFNLESMKHY